MKKIAIAALFLLGLIEVFFPLDVAATFYAYGAQFRRDFDVSKLTDQQQQLCQQFHVAINSKCHAIFYLGIATILIGIILLAADSWKKPGT